jgi:dTDP-4-dehydrorhamnose 3,5-epimerase
MNHHLPLDEIELPDGRCITWMRIQKGTIDGVEIVTHEVHSDRRGWLMEIYRADQEVGYMLPDRPQVKAPRDCTPTWQVYSSAVYRGVVKAFHCHSIQNDYVTCVSGRIWMVLVDTRIGDTYGCYMEIPMGRANPVSVLIPHGVWHGWMGLAEESVVVNIPDALYNCNDPDEERMPPNSLYNWRDIDG